MANPTLIKSYDCPAAVAAYRICAWGAADGEVAQGAAAADPLMGVADSLGGAAGGRVDVVRAGIAEVEYGGAVSAGDSLTTDAQGRAVVAAAGNVVLGKAEQDGVLGDIGEVFIAPAVL